VHVFSPPDVPDEILRSLERAESLFVAGPGGSGGAGRSSARETVWTGMRRGSSRRDSDPIDRGASRPGPRPG